MTTGKVNTRQGKRQTDTVHTLARAALTTKSLKAPLVKAPATEVLASIDARPIGYVDELSFQTIHGWAWDPTQPDEHVIVEILDGDRVVLELTADMFRADLQQAGIGNGCHAFLVNAPATLFPGSRHNVRVQRKGDAAPLRQGDEWINRTEAGFDSIAADSFAQSIAATITAARDTNDLEQPLSTILDAVNLLIAARTRLEADKLEGARHLLGSLAERTTLSEPMRALFARIRHTAAPLYFEDHDALDVSIVIPVHGEFQTTYNCVKAIHDAAAVCKFEIIIVDDCSTDETLLASLVFTGCCRIVRNASNLGFVGSCNAGAALARGGHIVFLNNDTLVRPGWLDALLETFADTAGIGIAGSKLLFPDGKLQEAGGIIWRLGDGWNWGRGRDPAEPAFSYMRDADWVSGAAMMIPTALFRKLEGFDAHFAPGYYEDTDLAFRVRAAGLRVVVQPASQVVHLEGVTSGTDEGGSGMKRFQRINLQKFQHRWASTLAQHRYNGQQPELEVERLVQRRALFIDDSVPTPDQDAGSNAALEHMLALMALGYKVTFLPGDNMARIDPYTANLQKLGIECLYAPYVWSVEEVFRKAVVPPDLVYLHRPSNAAKYTAMTRVYFPISHIIYSVADLHFLRMDREATLHADPLLRARAAAQRQSELAIMRTADCIVVHSTYEAALLGEIDPTLAPVVAPWTIHLRPTPFTFEQRQGFAFVGGFGHAPNVDAVEHLARDIMPHVRRATEVPAYIVGSKVPPQISRLQARDFTIVGYVPALADVLHRVRCTVVPLRFGAGIKGKVLESLAHGLPCIMSDVAAEGMNLPGTLEWLIARSPAEFASKLAIVCNDKALNAELAEAGLDFIRTFFSAQAVCAALASAAQPTSRAIVL